MNGGFTDTPEEGSERVDHVDRAMTLINWVDSAEGRMVLTTAPVGVEVVIASAQVHATLALVEQQRFANLIAVATWNVDALRRGARRDGKEADVVAEYAAVDAIFATVREGLGL